MANLRLTLVHLSLAGECILLVLLGLCGHLSPLHFLLPLLLLLQLLLLLLLLLL